jgi:hypothetical protein
MGEPTPGDWIRMYFDADCCDSLAEWLRFKTRCSRHADIHCCVAEIKRLRHSKRSRRPSPGGRR